jgi:hypothetical protein
MHSTLTESTSRLFLNPQASESESNEFHKGAKRGI